MGPLTIYSREKTKQNNKKKQLAVVVSLMNRLCRLYMTLTPQQHPLMGEEEKDRRVLSTGFYSNMHARVNDKKGENP